jgi:hypothetical protein
MVLKLICESPGYLTMFKALLAKIGQKLSDAGLPYMIIGGQAILLYGSPRLTKDIDITLGVNIDGLESTLKTVKDMGWKSFPISIICEKNICAADKR